MAKAIAPWKLAGRMLDAMARAGRLFWGSGRKGIKGSAGTFRPGRNAKKRGDRSAWRVARREQVRVHPGAPKLKRFPA